MTDFAYWSECITQIVSMMELCIEGYCLYRFVKPFLRSAKVAWAAGGFYFLTMLVLDVLLLYVDAFIAYALGSLMAFLVMYGLERRNGTQKAFLAITYFSLRWFTATIAELLYDKLYYRVENTTWFQRNPTVSMELTVYTGVCVFYLIMVFLITTASVCCITRSYICKYEQMTKREMFMLVSPPFLGVVGYKVIRYYRIFYILENGKPAKGYDMLLMFYCGLAIVVVVILIMLYENIKAAQEEKTANQLLSRQIDNLKRHIEQVENLYQGIRSMKHDMTNHILTLERLYAGNNVEEAIDYGKELKSALSPMAEEIKSGNPVTDVILQELKSEAEKRSIHFRSDFYFPTGTKINAFDVSVILSNALQNAMESIMHFSSEKAGKSEVPHISVLSYHRNNAYMIEISNSFTGDMQWDEERGLPVTSKEKKDGHGYGLANIRMVAKKYSGDIAIDLKDDEFRLSIMLMME